MRDTVLKTANAIEIRINFSSAVEQLQAIGLRAAVFSAKNERAITMAHEGIIHKRQSTRRKCQLATGIALVGMEANRQAYVADDGIS
ncbi:MAG: hypothetical protein WA957_08310 [Alteraurantiacibacter sp.]